MMQLVLQVVRLLQCYRVRKPNVRGQLQHVRDATCVPSRAGVGFTILSRVSPARCTTDPDYTHVPHCEK